MFLIDFSGMLEETGQIVVRSIRQRMTDPAVSKI